MTNRLHQQGVELLAYLLDDCLFSIAITHRQLYFDKFMICQGALYLSSHIFGEAFSGYGDHWLKIMTQAS